MNLEFFGPTLDLDRFFSLNLFRWIFAMLDLHQTPTPVVAFAIFSKKKGPEHHPKPNPETCWFVGLIPSSLSQYFAREPLVKFQWALFDSFLIKTPGWIYVKKVKRFLDFKDFPLTPSPVGFLLFLQHSLKLVRSGLIMRPEEMAGVESSFAPLFKQKPWQVLPTASLGGWFHMQSKCGYKKT